MLMVFVVFILFVLIGMPVGLAIGISGVFFFLQNPELPLEGCLPQGSLPV